MKMMMKECWRCGAEFVGAGYYCPTCQGVSL